MKQKEHSHTYLDNLEISYTKAKIKVAYVLQLKCTYVCTLYHNDVERIRRSNDNKMNIYFNTFCNLLLAYRHQIVHM